jgi:hypothetical protein
MNCEYGKCARIILPMFCVWLKSSAASTCLIKQTKCQCCMGKQAEERVPSQDTYGQTGRGDAPFAGHVWANSREAFDLGNPARAYLVQNVNRRRFE